MWNMHMHDVHGVHVRVRVHVCMWYMHVAHASMWYMHACDPPPPGSPTRKGDRGLSGRHLHRILPIWDPNPARLPGGPGVQFYPFWGAQVRAREFSTLQKQPLWAPSTVAPFGKEQKVHF